jgi:hypothetical protein
MLIKTLIAGGLVVVTIFIHAVGFSAMIRAMIRLHTLTMAGYLPLTRLLIGLTSWLMLIHLVEIAFWGLSYYWLGCLPDANTAFYYSGFTYVTAGYGDVALPERWQMLALLEGLTGVLMCGLSTGLFFAVVNQWIGNRIQINTAS